MTPNNTMFAIFLLFAMFSVVTAKPIGTDSSLSSADSGARILGNFDQLSPKIDEGQLPAPGYFSNRSALQPYERKLQAMQEMQDRLKKILDEQVNLPAENRTEKAMELGQKWLPIMEQKMQESKARLPDVQRLDALLGKAEEMLTELRLRERARKNSKNELATFSQKLDAGVNEFLFRLRFQSLMLQIKDLSDELAQDPVIRWIPHGFLTDAMELLKSEE